MPNLTILAFSLTIPFGGPKRAPPDPWFGRDKVLHFTISAAIQAGTHSVLRANGYAYREAAWTAAAATMSTGIAKELWDRRRGRFFSWRDLTADAAGTGSGAILIRQVSR